MTPPGLDQVELRGDEHQLFRELHPEVLRLLRATLVTCEQTIEDACGFAWMQFVVYQPERSHVRAWLYVVARHEALRLIAQDDGVTLTGDTTQWAACRAADARVVEDAPQA